MVRLLFIFLLFLSLFLAAQSIQQHHLGEQDEQFSEELLLRPLPDRKVVAHFYFQSTVPPTHSYGRHHRLFPKAIYQLVQKYRVREMELSFTQGRWNYERWGGYDPVSSSNAKPPGAELWAVFDVPKEQVDSSWKNLTHTLSGLFCASINFLDSSTTYSAPEWAFRPYSSNLRYGTLPREAVCTENLTPWLKLLPCRDKSGLSALMDRPSVYNGFYHSQRLHLKSGEFESKDSNSGMVLEQSLTIVRQPINLRTSETYSSGSILQPSWSLSTLFGRKLSGRCVLAKSSHIYVQLDRNLVSALENAREKNGWSKPEILALDGSWSNPSFELSVSPDRVIREKYSSREGGTSILYDFLIESYQESEPFDLGFKWKAPLVWSCAQAPLHASRFLMGSGNLGGSIAISLKSTGQINSLQSPHTSEVGCALQVHVFQVVPWYVKVYYHTLQVYVDEKLQSVKNVTEKINVSPSEDKVSPGVMELMLRLPCGMKSAALILEFDKGFLHIDEYPPDANQGFDIPSALISFPDFQTSLHFTDDNSLDKSALLSKLQERSPVLSYTEVLLVPLATPDFSMPYNVLTITCTVLALYFGSLLNALRRRAGEEERLMRNKAARKTGGHMLLSKLRARLRGIPLEQSQPLSPSSSPSTSRFKLIIKVIVVAGIAVGWRYILE